MTRFPLRSAPGDGLGAIPHVLVADADRSVRTRYHEQFQSIGWTVTEAPGGHEALVHALIQPPRPVVADFHLPIVDGIALSDILRRDDTTRNVPVFVLAALALVDGNMIGAATVGHDGVVGIEASWSDRCVSVHDMVVQVAPLRTQQIEVPEFRRALRACPAPNDPIAGYVQRLHYINARLLACTAHHSIEQRCARWLLAMHDVADAQGLQFTLDGMAGMLGVRRQSVSGVATAFHFAGFIRHRYGVLTIVNRPALEAASCDCYAAIRRASAGITS